MKQTIRLQPDNYSKILREEVVPSGDLKGYVEVDVKNTKTGEIEHQENHNLIVYGGREWLLRRIFGNTLTGNEYASSSFIRWVGFGCGGGEPGNPLQCGTTLGSDNDLRQPVKIQMISDDTNSDQDASYGTRVFPNGTRAKGYYKKLNSVIIKEDHANPYVKNGVTQYPNLIAEIRIELGSDECNGKKYISGVSDLSSYQDINEIALFASEYDPKNPDPGEIFETDVTIFTPSTSNRWTKGSDIYTQLNSDPGEPYYYNNIDVPRNNYSLKVQYTPSQDGAETQSEFFDKNNTIVDVTLDNGSISEYIGLQANTIRIYKNNNNSIIVRDNNGDQITQIGTSWDISSQWILNKFGVNLNETNLEQFNFILIPNGYYTLSLSEYTKPSKANLFTIQYRDYELEPWKTLTKLNNFNFLSPKVIYNGHTKRDYIDDNTYYVNDISDRSIFRLVCNKNSLQTITVTEMKTEETSYDVKCYCSSSDITKLHKGDFVFTNTNEFQDYKTENYIPEDAPLKVLDVHDGGGNQNDPSYFIIERMGTYDVPENEGTNKIVMKMSAYTPQIDQPYTMFSRVCLSTIRKTIDREIVIIYKLYV